KKGDSTMTEHHDDRETVGQRWVTIPRSVVTVSIVRELLGVLADTALKTIPEPSLDPFADAKAAMEAGWAAADKRHQEIVREGGAGDDYFGEGDTEPSAEELLDLDEDDEDDEGEKKA